MKLKLQWLPVRKEKLREHKIKENLIENVWAKTSWERTYDQKEAWIKHIIKIMDGELIIYRYANRQSKNISYDWESSHRLQELNRQDSYPYLWLELNFVISCEKAKVWSLQLYRETHLKPQCKHNLRSFVTNLLEQKLKCLQNRW